MSDGLFFFFLSFQFFISVTAFISVSVSSVSTGRVVDDCHKKEWHISVQFEMKHGNRERERGGVKGRESEREEEEKENSKKNDRMHVYALMHL